MVTPFPKNKKVTSADLRSRIVDVVQYYRSMFDLDNTYSYKKLEYKEFQEKYSNLDHNWYIDVYLNLQSSTMFNLPDRILPYSPDQVRRKLESKIFKRSGLRSLQLNYNFFCMLKQVGYSFYEIDCDFNPSPEFAMKGIVIQDRVISKKIDDHVKCLWVLKKFGVRSNNRHLKIAVTDPDLALELKLTGFNDIL